MANNNIDDIVADFKSLIYKNSKLTLDDDDPIVSVFIVFLTQRLEIEKSLTSVIETILESNEKLDINSNKNEAVTAALENLISEVEKKNIQPKNTDSSSPQSLIELPNVLKYCLYCTTFFSVLSFLVLLFKSIF